jgi:hypothetical protein
MPSMYIETAISILNVSIPSSLLHVGLDLEPGPGFRGLAQVGSPEPRDAPPGRLVLLQRAHRRTDQDH